MTVRFERTTRIQAPMEHVFDLCLDVDLHAASMASSDEHAFAWGSACCWRGTCVA